MQDIEDFIKQQMADMEAKIKEHQQKLEDLQELGDVPELKHHLVHGTLYGYRHIGFKLTDFDAFMAWAREHCDPIHLIRGRYAGLYPEIPKTRDWEGAGKVLEGNAYVNYSTILQKFEVNVYKGAFRISFDAPLKWNADLKPVPNFHNYSRNKERSIESWFKPKGRSQLLWPSVDKQSADMSTLMDWDSLSASFRPQ